MSQHLLDVLTPPKPEESGKNYGVVVGLVTNNKDPDGMGRVKVKFPWLSDQQESGWARIAAPMAGASRGAYFLPEVDDEVLVAFEHGDVRFPYVLGAVWNGKDAPPATNSDGQNNIRLIKSRSGHIIRLDDTEGNEKVEVIDKQGANRVTINSSDNSITICCNGKMRLTANGIEISSQAEIKIQAASTMDINAGAPLNIKGAVVNIN